MGIKMIWSLDPGDLRIGYAAWKENGEFLDKGVWNTEQATRILADTIVSKIVIEDWRMTPGRTKGGSSMGASRIIGMCELRAYQLEIPLIRQSPQILRLAALHANVTLPKGHIPDDVSAYLHGYYYFEQQGLLHPVSLTDRM